ncbi:MULTISPECIES: hypothetical protein [unclassified Xanthomonas]|uniref:hypothetical protein n=1 Tax=Xanthomonas sp. LMG 8992 TaxID=1591157 RepID=UPI00136BD209|nr:hypothetical protein [Xanthomonas sp. LMG 8992]
MNRNIGFIAGALLAIQLTACNQFDSSEVTESDSKRYVIIEQRIESRDMKDRYSDLDRKSFVNVDRLAAQRALAGDGMIARMIGQEFSELNRADESRYWYQIGAENGDAIAMQNLSIALRVSDCVRANFWLKKALEDKAVKKIYRDAWVRDLEHETSVCAQRASS